MDLNEIDPSLAQKIKEREEAQRKVEELRRKQKEAQQSTAEAEFIKKKANSYGDTTFKTLENCTRLTGFIAGAICWTSLKNEFGAASMPAGAFALAGGITTGIAVGLTMKFSKHLAALGMAGACGLKEIGNLKGQNAPEGVKKGLKRIGAALQLATVFGVCAGVWGSYKLSKWSSEKVFGSIFDIPSIQEANKPQPAHYQHEGDFKPQP